MLFHKALHGLRWLRDGTSDDLCVSKCRLRSKWLGTNRLRTNELSAYGLRRNVLRKTKRSWMISKRFFVASLRKRCPPPGKGCLRRSRSEGFHPPREARQQPHQRPLHRHPTAHGRLTDKRGAQVRDSEMSVVHVPTMNGMRPY